MRKFASALTGAIAAFTVAGGSGCLARPVGTTEPSTKISFETVVAQPAVDKIDLLIMVDNSASMADKQRILADAVPDLLEGLVKPKCVDPETRQPTGQLADPTKSDEQACPAGSEPAFPPISDIHIGVISSSMGGMGASNCSDVDGRQNDDRARLVARAPKGGVLASAGDDHFLAWYPNVAKNQDKKRHPEPTVPAIGDVDELGAAFRDLVVGVGQRGCGLEAQLESVYKFLVQPDPWTEIVKGDSGATYGAKDDVDEEILAQRAAFLRPDSLVAVIMLTDEDDSSADPLAFQGSGYRFMDPRPLPRATKACAKDVTDPKCLSCSVAKNEQGCSEPDYSEEEDPLNVRFHHMKQRYGVDPQFPIARYVTALTQPRVPGREQEHDAMGNYVPKAGCTNPLFAAKLPKRASDELCDLPRGPRSPSLVYFALIGGVPSKLLPDGRTIDEKIDWVKILGRDPLTWDEEGIDSHMIQSSEPRDDLEGPSAADDADPVHGREWTTGGGDLQYACTFDLYERDGSGQPQPVARDCTEAIASGIACDCDGKSDTPLCSPQNRTVQVKGKAYPTRRELMLAKDLGDQGVVASLCPVQLTKPDADDYGYRPAVRSITQRLERSLVGSCLPRALERDGEDGKVSCLVLAMLPEEGGDDDCEAYGLEPPKATLLAQVRKRMTEEEGSMAATHPICEIPQVKVAKGKTCRNSAEEIGFCYTEAPAITQCAHALSFTKPSEKLAGARFTMQCIQQTGSDIAP